MSNLTGSFQADLTLDRAVTGFKETASAFSQTVFFDASTSANRNSLAFTVTSSNSLSLFDPFPGPHKYPGATSYVGEPSPRIGTLTLI